MFTKIKKTNVANVLRVWGLRMLLILKCYNVYFAKTIFKLSMNMALDYLCVQTAQIIDQDWDPLTK